MQQYEVFVCWSLGEVIGARGPLLGGSDIGKCGTPGWRAGSLPPLRESLCYVHSSPVTDSFLDYLFRAPFYLSRGQMQTIISRALTDVGIKPTPSRRCFTLMNWLESR